MTSFTEHIRRLYALGYIDDHGELTPKGEQFAEERHSHMWDDDDDARLGMDLEPLPDSGMY